MIFNLAQRTVSGNILNLVVHLTLLSWRKPRAKGVGVLTAFYLKLGRKGLNALVPPAVRGQYSQLPPTLLPLCPAAGSGSLYGNWRVVSKLRKPSFRE